MSFVDSSVGSSPLALAGADPEDVAESVAPGQEDQVPTDPADEEFPQGSLSEMLVENAEDINLARYMEQGELDRIGAQVVEEFKLDQTSREDWAQKAQKAMAFATQDAKAKQFPWADASNVIYPLIGQAALEWHANTYPAVIQGQQVVKGCVWSTDMGTPVKGPDGQPQTQTGPDGQPRPVWLSAPGEKRKRADRIGDHMSYQLLKEMPEWERQTDQAILQSPIAGGFLRKTYYDPVEKRNVSLVVSLMNLVWDYHAPSFEAAPRHTEKLLVYPHEIVENERKGAEGEEAGMWLAISYAAGNSDDGTQYGYDKDGKADELADPDAPQMFIEQHRRMDLDGDGYPEPYIMTVHLGSGKVVRIVARYDKDGVEATDDGGIVNKITPEDQYTLYDFLPNMEGGSYPMGFGHMLKPINEGINTLLNQMIDAGTLQNAGGGFISDQFNGPSGQTLFEVGKFHRINTKGQSIKDAVFPLPFQGPSATLFQLLGVLLEAGKSIAAIKDILTGEAGMSTAAPTTVLALIEQGMRVYTALIKRFFRAEKAELDKLYRLNRKHLKEVARYQKGDEWLEVTPEDYRLGGGVEPIADPTMVTNMQKLGRAQLLMTFLGNPLVKQDEILRRVFDASGIDRVEDLMQAPDPQMQQIMQQKIMLELQQLTAELGKTRAAELKDHTQAFLNMALARKNATAAEEVFIEQQLTYLRLHIESVNATTRAAEVDIRAHTAHRADHHANEDRAQRERDRMSRERVAALPVEGVDHDTFPVPPSNMPEMPGDATVGPAPGGVPADMGGEPR